MTQYTFNPVRPVDSSDFDTSRRGMAQAGNSFNTGIEALKDVIRNQQGIQKQNYQQGIVNNDTAIKANLDKIASLGALRDAEPTTEMLEAQYGKQYTPGSVKGFVDARKSILGDRAYSAAAGIGTQAADGAYSVPKGAQAVQDYLVQNQGADPEWAMAKSAEWEKSASTLKNQYNQVKADNTKNFYSTYENTPAQSANEITMRLAAGREKFKDTGGFDESAAHDYWTQGLAGKVSDEDRIRQMQVQARADRNQDTNEGRNTEEYNWKKANRDDEIVANQLIADRALAVASGQMSQGEALDKDKDSLPAGVYDRLFKGLPGAVNAMSAMSEEQKRDYAAKTNEFSSEDAILRQQADQAIAKEQAIHDSMPTTNIKKLSEAYSTEDLKNFDGVVSKINNETGLFRDSKPEELSKLKAEFTQLYGDKAGVMIAQAWMDVKDKSDAWIVGQGVNIPAIRERAALNHSIDSARAVKAGEIAKMQEAEATRRLQYSVKSQSDLEAFRKGQVAQNTGGIAPPSSGSVSIPSGTLAYANNNPGNLKYAGQNGATVGEKGFAKFPTPEAGYAALKRQIKLDASKDMSLGSFINKYAPSSENDTGEYINFVTERLGVSPGTGLKAIDNESLAQAMAQKESSTKINATAPSSPTEPVKNASNPGVVALASRAGEVPETEESKKARVTAQQEVELKRIARDKAAQALPTDIPPEDYGSNQTYNSFYKSINKALDIEGKTKAENARITEAKNSMNTSEDNLASFMERPVNYVQQNVLGRTQSGDSKRIGENAVTRALRLQGNNPESLNKRNRIFKSLRREHPEMSEVELAELILKQTAKTASR